MSDLERAPLRKASLSSISHSSYIHFSRRNVLTAAAGLWFLFSLYPVYLYLSDTTSATSASDARRLPSSTATISSHPTPAFAPGTANSSDESSTGDDSRRIDQTDAFADFVRSTSCNFSTLDLHKPFSPICGDKDSLLNAMTGGGRIGIDAPYSPRGCDMRWFRTDELCSILSRFHEVTFIGDSMVRNLAVAMNILLRKDLVNGPRTAWLADPEGLDCSCGAAFSTSKCVFHSVFSSTLAYDHAPETMFCPRVSTAIVEFVTALEYPLENDQIGGLETHFQSRDRPAKPRAFVLGHGLWNKLNTSATLAWTKQVQDTLKDRMPYLYGDNEVFPKLFVSPNAAGELKPDFFISEQGNIALSKFEHAIGPAVREMGFDHLGTYNMTIQGTSPDGTHGGYRASLTKAMMVYNWLSALDTSAY